MNVWTEASRRLAESRPFRALLDRGGDVVRLPVPAAAWVGGLAARERGRPWLVVVPHEADALAWVEAVRLFGGSDDAIYFPSPGLTPYQTSDLSLSVRAQEVLAVERLLGADSVGAVVTTPRGLFVRLPEPTEFSSRCLRLATGEDRSRDELVEALVEAGYHRADLVGEIGDFAVRGGLIDCYPPGSETPLRIDFFGDTVETIRRFDLVTQRSSEAVDEATILPLTLFPSGVDAMTLVAEHLESIADDDPSLEVRERLRDLAGGRPYPGWESQAVALAPRTLGLADLLGDVDLVVVDPETVRGEAEQYGNRLGEEYRALRRRGEPVLEPEILTRGLGAVEADLERARVRIGPIDATDQIDFSSVATDLFQGQLPRFPREVASVLARGDRAIFVASEGRGDQIAELLGEREIPVGSGGLEMAEGELTRGFRLPAAGVTLFAEAQLFPTRGRRRRKRTKFGPFLSGLRDLKVGDHVVHIDHGIGRFVGLRTVDPDDGGDRHIPAPLRAARPESGPPVEVMEIAYKDGRTLLLPLTRIDHVQRYSGIEGMAPNLDRLGGASWSATKSRVRKSVRQLAIDLTRLYAERELAEAPVIESGTDLQRQFRAAFPFDETEDQEEAIEAIEADLAKGRPMDRLLCGDVGFGKTEVAMRAAFAAVDAGHQVAVLAPTTILADQHLETFRDRFDGFPITIEMISRFRTTKEIKQVREAAKAGRVDILIGTHRLLSKDIELPRLALLIVDEEQRFGVAQKERLRDLKKSVHVLAMSATPVPRTLQLSFAGVREMSVIETPPRGRMAVETAILPFTGDVVRDAIEFELDRGGQVYYVYNRVEDIDRMAVFLRELRPGLRVTIGHGQMDERELSKRMHAFTAGEYDLLLATTIIENGIHIPRVNTMLVHRADRFGLAQLYQLRGRVGRSDQLGYCYLLVPSDRTVSQTARKRLDALRDFTELGAGFRIAARDLEIRGAGNLLGAEQSGHIVSVGIETYIKLLEETIKELRGETIDEAPAVTLDLPVALAIPDSYIEDPNVRMEIYRRLGAADEEPAELLAELRDRFGSPPSAVRELLEVATVKRLAESLRIQAISLVRGELVVRLRRDSKIDPERLVLLVSETEGATFSPEGVLSVRADDAVLGAARSLLERLVG